MIDILSSTQLLLRSAGYATLLMESNPLPLLRFEDESSMGFAITFKDPAEMIDRWRNLELSLLKQHAAMFRAAGEKAWNVYTVLLSGSLADAAQAREVRWIEEDLQRTRKLTACGIDNREDLLRAILPILPLQYKPALVEEDVTERLLRRVRSIAPKAAAVLLENGTSPAEVVRLLGEP